MKTLEYFAAHAPMPDDNYMAQERMKDRNKNPHNESRKPKLRDSLEIIVDYKIAFATMMYNKIGGTPD